VTNLQLLLFEMPRPDVVDPIDLSYDLRSRDERIEFGAREFKTEENNELQNRELGASSLKRYFLLHRLLSSQHFINPIVYDRQNYCGPRRKAKLASLKPPDCIKLFGLADVT